MHKNQPFIVFDSQYLVLSVNRCANNCVLLYMLVPSAVLDTYKEDNIQLDIILVFMILYFSKP